MTKQTKSAILIVLFALCLIFAALAILSAFSDEYVRAQDKLAYYETDLGRMIERSPIEISNLQNTVSSFETRILIFGIASVLFLAAGTVCSFIKVK